MNHIRCKSHHRKKCEVRPVEATERSCSFPMWIVKLALDRPYTFIVLALLILIMSPVIILRTPTDIFPNINIPVVAVAWQYTGLNPEEMEGRLTTPL